MPLIIWKVTNWAHSQRVKNKKKQTVQISKFTNQTAGPDINLLLQTRQKMSTSHKKTSASKMCARSTSSHHIYMYIYCKRSLCHYSQSVIQSSLTDELRLTYMHLYWNPTRMQRRHCCHLAQSSGFLHTLLRRPLSAYKNNIKII